MPEPVTLYHGSIRVIEKPEFGKGNPRNDYGLGFYCTEDLELAREWACSTIMGGYVNTYSLDISQLSIMKLSDPKYVILNWLAILVNNRIFDITSPMVAEAKEYLTEHFLPDMDTFDVIIGYRADDSYFTFAMDFLSNTISLHQLSSAMSLGSLSNQVMLRTPKAFGLLHFIGSEAADGETYYAKRRNRDNDARKKYLRRERRSSRLNDDVFMLDILRGEMKQGDARLQGGISS